MSRGLHVAVVGATGAVGREMVALLERRGFPVARLTLLASARSAGKVAMPFAGQEVPVRELTVDSFEGVQVALFSAGGARSRDFAPAAARAGAVVIDNSSHFRMQQDVPLVVPEVNPERALDHRGIIANPNCSTIQMVLPLQALHQRAGLRRVVVSTYQSAAGAGQAGIDELLEGTRQALRGEPIEARTFPRPLAFDAIPQISGFEPSGYTTEEEKMLHETRKIMGLPELPVSATCVRVPVLRGHLEAVSVDLDAPLTADEARAAIGAFPGVRVVEPYPTARDCVGELDTLVGRIRRDPALPNTLHFWVVSDNLLKGAAWNAVQIAELLVERGHIRVD